MTRIKHLGDLENYNSELNDISDQHFLESYMGGLKEDIKHYIFLKQLENVLKSMQYSFHFV